MRNHIAIITFNWPEWCNALTECLTEESLVAFGALESDDDVHVLAFGRAGNAFCGGLDLTEISARERRLLMTGYVIDGLWAKELALLT